MGKKIDIILIILAYLLNIAHDIQKHEHHEQDHFHLFKSKHVEHLHDTITKCQHSDDESKETPFTHCHLEHAHENVLLRNTQNSANNSDFSEPCYTVFCLQIPGNILFEYFQTDNDIDCNKIVFLSFSLRAPPDIS